jgi:RNA polymerase sigma factor (sigma-70 family)
MQPIPRRLCLCGVCVELTQRLADDLDSAFPELVMQHQDLVYGVALRVVGNAADAEDVAQDAFLRAHRALTGYAAARISALRLRPWLARIALNLARNHVRARRADAALETDLVPAGRSRDEPVSIAERREEHMFWAGLLARLPERQRICVGLRHVDGLSYPELAAALGRPLGSVKSDVHRGVRLLRAAYEAERRHSEGREAI